MGQCIPISQYPLISQYHYHTTSLYQNTTNITSGQRNTGGAYTSYVVIGGEEVFSQENSQPLQFSEVKVISPSLPPSTLLQCQGVRIQPMGTGTTRLYQGTDYPLVLHCY